MITSFIASHVVMLRVAELMQGSVLRMILLVLPSVIGASILAAYLVMGHRE